MNLDFKEINKQSFQCLQIPDGSIYYGELEYCNKESGELMYNYEELTEEQKQECKLIRHGYGIQLFGKTDNDLLCKYVGQWDKDRKHGEGQCCYPDGSEYKGHYKYDQFDGYGQFKWAPNEEQLVHVYEGYWKDGKMDGGGEFRHGKGFSLKGLFKNNLYNYENKLFLNPFNDREFNDKYVQNADKHLVEQQRLNKEFEERVRLYRVNTLNDFYDTLQKCKDEGRTPLLLGSLESKVESPQVHDCIQQRAPQANIFNLYLRDLGLKIKNASREQYQDIKRTLSSNVQMSVHSQGIINLYFDECEGDQKSWKELYDPDIDDLFGNDALPYQIWRFNQFAKREVMESIGVIDRYEDENARIAQFSQIDLSIFMFLIWSKLKLSEDLDDENLLKKFKQRFEKSLPLRNINMVFIQSLNDESQEAQEANQNEEQQQDQ